MKIFWLLFSVLCASLFLEELEGAPSSMDLSPGDLKPMMETDLYFGTVPAKEWNDFLADYVTPRFPDGLTWSDVHGQWRTPAGEEKRLESRILILIYVESPSSDKAIEEIRRTFKSRFHQVSVLRVTRKVEAAS